MLQELAAATGKRIVFYCAFGERSAMAVQAAQDAGTTACHIQGGIDAWKKAGGPGTNRVHAWSRAVQLAAVLSAKADIVNSNRINKKPPSTTLGGFLATYEID